MDLKPRIHRRDALGLAACGMLAAAGVARADGKYKVNIVNTDSNSTRTLQALLRNKGWLEEFGVEATTLNVSDGSKLMGALISGSSDICLLSGFGQVLVAIEKGAKVKVVGGASLLPSQALFTKRPEIKTLKDLEGRTIGSGSIGALLHQITSALLTKKGVDVSKVRFVNVGSSADVFRAVVAGVVDAGPALSDVYDQRDKYGVHVPEGGKFWEELPEYTYQGSYASDRAIAGNREGLVRVLAAYGKMYRYISGPNSLDDYVKARLEGVGGNHPEAAAEATNEWRFVQRYQPYATDLVLSQERISYMQGLNVQFDLQKSLTPYDKATDMSMARDAIKLIN